MIRLSDYAQFIGRSNLEELSLLANRLDGKSIRIINSTFTGGGVAEILSRMLPLFKQLGLNVEWDIIQGNEDFYTVTKKFHNAIHGRKEIISEEEFNLFLEISQRNIEGLNLAGDILFIHDPQPIVLIQKKKELGKNWIWRCHIDASAPDPKVWNFLLPFILQYDAAIFSSPAFCTPLPIRQFIICPSIDPLSPKNMELDPETINSVLSKYGIPRDKPIITQISRFDYLKDPVGLIRSFKLVKKSIDARLLLVGGTATDDPEGEKVLKEVREEAQNNPDIHILLIPAGSDVEINAFQSASDVIVQKSLKEGFALTVSEALWKGKPVVASAVGGIPFQIINGLTGLLSYGIEGTAYDIKRVLNNAEFAHWLGKNGREHVRQNFLITRHIRDYLLTFLINNRPEEIIYL